jgi:hypothetical protein
MGGTGFLLGSVCRFLVYRFLVYRFLVVPLWCCEWVLEWGDFWWYGFLTGLTFFSLLFLGFMSFMVYMKVSNGRG